MMIDSSCQASGAKCASDIGIVAYLEWNHPQSADVNLSGFKKMEDKDVSSSPPVDAEIFIEMFHGHSMEINNKSLVTQEKKPIELGGGSRIVK